ncbi:helix-turn-helix transcriptional regulator [Streptomyces fructofermentans]|uniref:helix-turn-helix transcriptional regulator n=1 Tax=Streptomyces fructofermentans TaxID=152141 RepID=UPI0033BFC2C8
MAQGSELGDYLRSRRERVRPEDLGLPAGDRRRVTGLRREEVALLAGISTEYYLRLEQGRDRHPSDQVVDSIARALLLDGDETTYLHDLARPVRPARRRTPRQEKAGDGVRSLIDGWTTTPALVQGRYMTTLAANPMATALSPYYAPGVNSLRAAFLEPEMREFFRDWDGMTAKAVAYLRSLLGSDVADDPGLVELVGELSLRSERFRGLWFRKDVRLKTSGITLIRHPLVGDLDLHYEKLALPGAPGQMLVTYHAPSPGPSRERLQMLAHLAAGATAPTGGPGGAENAGGAARPADRAGTAGEDTHEGTDPPGRRTARP